MNPTEILAAFQTARTIFDFAVSQYHLAEQNGTLTDEQKAGILDAARLSDDQVDAAVQAAKQRLAVKG